MAMPPAEIEQRLTDWTKSEDFMRKLPPSPVGPQQERILGLPVKNWQAKLLQARMNMIRKRMAQLRGGVGEFLTMPSRAMGAIGRSLSPPAPPGYGDAGAQGPRGSFDPQMLQEMGGGYSIEPPPRRPVIQQPPLSPPPQPIQRSPWR